MQVATRYKLFSLPTLLSLIPLLTLFTLSKQLLSKRAIIPIHMTGWIPLRLLRLLEHLRIRQEICTHDELVPDGKNRRCQSREHKQWSCRVARPLWFRSRTCIILCYHFFIFYLYFHCISSRDSLHCHLFVFFLFTYVLYRVVSICLFCMFVICS